MTVLNRHPVDELADVRAEVARLKDREDTLRKLIIDGECGMRGDDFLATVTTARTERLDTKAVREAFEPEVLKPFIRTSEITTVKTKPMRAGDNE